MYQLCHKRTEVGTNLERSQELIRLGPLGNLGLRVVVVCATVGGARLLPDRRHWREAVHRVGRRGTSDMLTKYARTDASRMEEWG